MAFNFWADEQMTTLFGAANGEYRMTNAVFDQVGQTRDFTVYFGNPKPGTKLEAAANPGTDNIVLSAESALAAWQADKDYAADTVIGADGWLYRCTQAGRSGSATPSWLAVAGSNTSDGAAVWRCIGHSHATNSVKLALSKSGLDTAGSSVSLGVSIPAGAAVAVYIRLTNDVADLYDLPTVPQVGIRTVKVLERAA